VDYIFGRGEYIFKLPTFKKMKPEFKKKLIKWLIAIIAFFMIAHFIIDFYFQGIDYKETFRTQYHTTDSNQIIETSHFKILTPKNWIHIFHGYGYEANACGCFITGQGRIEYDYGFLTDSFEVDSISVFKQDSMTLNRFKIFIGENENDEIGIHIPRQHEMEFSFSFFMSKACKDNFEELTTGIKSLEFKKFYNIEWTEE